MPANSRRPAAGGGHCHSCIAHRPEFCQSEQPPLEAGPLLCEENGAAHHEPNPELREQQDRAEQYQQHSRNHRIKPALSAMP